MVKDHSDSERERERGNPLPPHGLLFPISSKGSFIYTVPQTGLCYTSRGALAGTRNSSMGPPCRIDPTTHRTLSEPSYHGATSRSSWNCIPRRSPFRLGNARKSHGTGRKEGNVLFNDALNTFYLRLYGVTHNNGKVPHR